MSPPLVLVLGDVMDDIVVTLAGPIRRGTDQRASIRHRRGGAGVNQAAWLAHCGVPVRLLACVADRDREAAQQRLARYGVEAALIGHPVLPSGQLIALVDPDGERSFLTDRGANDGLALASLPAEILDGVGHLHVSGYAFVGAETRATAGVLIERARAKGLPVSFDPGSAGFVAEVGAPPMLALAAAATLCVANADEALALTGLLAPQDQLQALSARFALVLIKRGAAGALGRHQDGRHWDVPAPAVAMVDTIGAGDAFLAGYLAARLAGAPIGAALAQAVARGAEAVTLAGGLPLLS